MKKQREVEEAKKRCESLLNRIQNLNNLSSSSSSSSQSTLLRLVQSELSFLNRVSLSLNPNNNANTSPLSVNIGHLEAIVHILEQPTITGVSRVCKPVPSSQPEEQGPNPKSIYVDIICSLNGRPVWFIVSSRNSKYISYQESPKTKGLKARITQLLDSAKSCTSQKPSSIILFFSKGLDEKVNKKVKLEFEATDLLISSDKSFNCSFIEEEQEDEWVDVINPCLLEIKVGSTTPSPRISTVVKLKQTELKGSDVNITLGESITSLMSAMKWFLLDGEDEPSDLVNFDTTALIAIVSGISNGGTGKILGTNEDELRRRFKGNLDFVIGQVKSEIENPIHIELTNVLCGKRGIVCESVSKEFLELVNMCGGPNEKFRANHILKQLMVVPDCISMRLMNLPTTRKLALKNKVVFGTGDYWNAPTLTANMAFVRAISQTGVSLSTIEHRPMALIGD